MAYTALYRRFRPMTFDEMVGQEHITRTLKNQIISNRIGHAYLFNGSRGTGKTSAAKILARAINCLHPINGEPCNKCEICKGIIDGSLIDVLEMDAASNNGVDDIRVIREEVNFFPTLAKYRVYIIDEVHMLSTGAFNALLKTLEEPPEHVKFILATTEPQKLPATILSRCQRFDFKRIGIDKIIERLNIICKEGNITISKEAVRMIAVLAEGGLRDAISILERCIQDGEMEINETKIRELVGIPSFEHINKIVKGILEYNPEEAINEINEVINSGKDVDNFLWEIIKYIKDILMFKATNSIELYNENEIAELKKLSEITNKERLFKLIYDLSETASQIKWSSQKSILFETSIIKACIKQEEVKIERTQELKKEPEKIVTPREVQDVKKTKPEVKSNGPKAEFWSKVLEDLKSTGKIMLYTNLIGTNATQANDMIVEIEFPNKITAFAKTVLEQYENKTELEKRISMELGNNIRVKYVEKSAQQDKKQSSIPNGLDSLMKESSINIDIVEE